MSGARFEQPVGRGAPGRARSPSSRRQFLSGWAGGHRETKAYRRAEDPGLWEMLWEMGRLGDPDGAR